MKRNLLLLATILLFELPRVFGAAAVSLAGEWRFRLDRDDAGVGEQWFGQVLPDRVRLPGDLAEQGIGDRPTIDTKWIGGIKNPRWWAEPELARYATPENFKFPYWLTPERYYAGAAWYQRDIEIPAAWRDKRIALHLERAHTGTRVWVDEKPFGTQNSLGTPHDYDLGSLTPGRHVLTIRVDNRLVIDVGDDSHSVSDHTQGNWNGIVGRLELRATPAVWIEHVGVYPERTSKRIRVSTVVRNVTGKRQQATLKVAVSEADGAPPIATAEKLIFSDGAEAAYVAELACPDNVASWDEFSPRTYAVTAEVELRDLGDRDTRTVTCGFREITTEGTQFVINGRKTFFRGTLECAIFPKTGHPPTDVASWEHVIGAAKAHGLNLLRFHSWCPPEAAFVAADRLGMYLQVECSSWANHSTTLGDGKPVDQWLYAETHRVLNTFGNHPSFVLLMYGNEPGGKNRDGYLARWVDLFRKADPRRLYSSGAGWPQLAENQFHVTPDPRIQHWGEGLKSRINAKPPETLSDYRDYIAARSVPVISHEIGQWCVYPNFDEIPKYTGYLKPRNFEIFRDRLEARHLGDQAHAFLIASGKLQTLCYKEDIESALRTPGMGGFELLDLHDFPGQGTALVGVLDPFWEQKGYVTPDEYRRFCNVTVPLARLAKRIFTSSEKLEAGLEIAHFGPRPIANAVTTWKLVAESGEVAASGEMPAKTIPIGNAFSLGKIEVALGRLPAPAKYKLVVGVGGTRPTGFPKHGRNARATTEFENDWDVWVYPDAVASAAPDGVFETDEWNDVAIQKLNAGGKVLLTIPPSRVAPDPKYGRIALGFSSIFWNTAWTNRQAPHTLGILCDPKHPLFAEFPTDAHSNWQWWYLITRAGPMLLDEMPSALRPVVQVIDDWVTARKLGLVFEARVGAGKLVVCSVDLKRDLERDAVRRQFRSSVLRYMAGPRFVPAERVSVEDVKRLFGPPSPLQKLGLVALKADSEELDNEAVNAMDSDPKTIWHTAWRAGATEFPHELRLEFGSARLIRGFTALPRQDGNRNGWIRDYAFYASRDGVGWGEPVARGSFDDAKALKTVVFERPVEGRFFKLVALSSFTRHASLAEFSLLEAEPVRPRK